MDPRQYLLKIALDLLGRATVAQRLDVPTVLLDDWLDADPPMPDAKHAALLDLLRDAAAASKTRRPSDT